VASRIGEHLHVDDETTARTFIPSLCGRDPVHLDADGMARATVESVAENTSDAVTGPLLWGALAGLPGLLGYRAVNTLDAMVGHRSPRYQLFGRTSARADDVVNLAPARITAALTVLLAPDASGRRAALRSWRADAAQHPSPNSGHPEAAMAGALGLRLGGETIYDGRVESRPTLGLGRTPTPADIDRAVRLSRRVQIGALACAIVGRLIVTAAVRRRGR
jgi:adenosylcobinamide-phosphate synthase